MLHRTCQAAGGAFSISQSGHSMNEDVSWGIAYTNNEPQISARNNVYIQDTVGVVSIKIKGHSSMYRL
jgi:hypothetical protein